VSNDFFVQNSWFLTGATAVGKTRVGLALAERLGAEIVSLDSMAIYRKMDIGTAKPSPVDQARLPHHLLDIVDPSEEFSVAEYLKAADQVVKSIRQRGREVLFVGGTPMYLKCLLRGFFDGPAANWEMRQQMEDEAKELAPGLLHQRLEQIDPLAASQIHANDTRRIIRALEVFRTTGQPISHQQMEFEEGRPAEECRVFVLRRDREEQRQRIETRVDRMLAAGLVDEVRQLTTDGKTLGRTANQAVGYRESLDHLSDAINEQEMAERIKARTRRFAKRQGTWFRSLSECRFVDLVGEEEASGTAKRIATLGGK